MKGKIQNPFKGIADKLTYKHMLMIAGLVSVLLALGIYVTLNNATRVNDDKPSVELVRVVVAKQDIAPRTKLTENMLKVVELPADSIPDGAARDVKDVVNNIVKIQIMKDDVITHKKLFSDIKQAGFTGLIPPDCRAMSLKISDVTGVAGFAKAGDYVDIMLITKDKGDGRVNGSIVLQNVLLLAINKTGETVVNGDGQNGGEKKDDSDKKGNGDKNKSGDSGNIKASGAAMATATVAVTPKQALELGVAASRGELYLALRPYQPKDKFVFDTNYSILDQLSKANGGTPSGNTSDVGTNAQKRNYAPSDSGSASAASSAASVPAPSISTGSVEVYRGTTGSREGR